MRGISLAVAGMFAVAGLLPAQQPNVAAQKEAMKKLEFLVGRWKGPASVRRGPGEPIRITQHENVQYKLDGLLLLIEGEGRDGEGKSVFGALAVVSFDDTTGTYRFRAFNDGRTLETEFKVEEKGFAWGYTAGALKVMNVMKVSESGEWVETTDATFGANPTLRTVEMKLARER
jgi:hypothetical protein